MTPVQRLVLGAAAAVAVAFATAVVVLSAAGSPVVGVVSNWTQILVPVAASAVCFDSARRQHEARYRRAWRLYGAGSLSWGVGQCVFTWYELVGEVTVPVPSVADVAFLLYPLLAAAAIWLLPDVPHSRAMKLRSLLDGLVIGSSLVFVVWALSLRHLWAAGDGDVAGVVVTTTYVLTDMVLLTMLALLLPVVGPGHRRVLVPVVLGTASFAVADLGYVVVTSSAEYASGQVFDVGWVLGFLGVAVAAALAHPRGGRRPVRRDPGTDLPSWATILLPYVPVLAASAVLLHRLGSSSPWTGAESALAGSVIVLVLVRQLVALADNRALLAEVSRQHQQARYDSQHDALTGLADRALFLERVTSALERAERTGTEVAVLFCDLDEFKQVNDVHGHTAGDRVLRAVGQRLAAQVRTVDCVARLGGDEFAILLEDGRDADRVAARVEEAAGDPVPVDGGEVHPRMSVGVARSRPGGGLGTDELVQLADGAMYRVKQSRSGEVLPRQGRPHRSPGSRVL